jgi:MerR family transcriptional regulator, redox-sensitive transcriptional activator SoxR
MAGLPAERTPTPADRTRLSATWRTRLDEQIEGLMALREGLTSCIGCGCLSLRTVA